MADSTGDGVWVPLWQAEPVEAATAGAAARRSCPRVPSMLMFSVFGRRWPAGPLRWTRPGSAWQVSSTAGCSVAWVITCGCGRPAASSAPRTASRFASEPEAVNSICGACAPIRAATCARASASARRGRSAYGWLLEGLPNQVVR
ncbi:hypothetical protein [Nonomuraea sp. B5E05]|uniref:hypothetical protein n=1 Tax=Nonomuraea sp. B5E05 TaxID=3153569 RepID=UPI0032608124